MGLPTVPFDEAIFSTVGPTSQMTLDYVKLTQNYPEKLLSEEKLKVGIGDCVPRWGGDSGHLCS